MCSTFDSRKKSVFSVTDDAQIVLSPGATMFRLTVLLEQP